MVVGVCLAITAFFGYFAMGIKLDLGFIALLDKEDPLIARANSANDSFGGMDYLVLVLTTPHEEPADKERLIRFANRLGPRLRENSDLIRRVVDRVDLDDMVRWAPLFLEGDDLDDFVREMTEQKDDLARLFTDTRLVPFLTQLNATLESDIIVADEIADPEDAVSQLDALGEFYETADRYLSAVEDPGDGPVKRSVRNLFVPETDEAEVLKDDYFFFDHDRALMLRVMATKPPDDYIFCTQVLDLVEKTYADVASQAPGIEMLYGGAMVVMRDEYRALVHDIKLSTWLSLALVLIIFIAVFRRVTDLALIGICLGAGLAITYGLTHFAIGFLSLLTAFFGAMMIGLGIDFAIHYMSRYRENLQNGLDSRDACIAAFTGAGPGIVTGATTTAVAFLALMIARFKGLSQLGFVSGAGILIMLALMLTLLPAMMALRERYRKRAGPTRAIDDAFSLGRLAEYAIRRPKFNSLAIIVSLLLAGWGALQTSFNYDYRSLEPRGAISMKHVAILEERLDRGLDYGLFVADDLTRIRDLTAKAKMLSTVREVESITDYIPENQPAKNAKLRTLAPVFDAIAIRQMPEAGDAFGRETLADYAGAVRGSVRVVRAVLQLAILGGQFEVEDKAREVMTRIESFAKSIDEHPNGQAATGATRYQRYLSGELSRLLESLRLSARGEELTVEKLPAIVREHFIGNDGRMVVYMYPTQNVWNEHFMKKHNAELLAVDETAVSVPIIFDAVVAAIKVDFKSSVWYSALAVFLLVLVDFRRLRTTLLAMLPLLSGGLWMVGIMPLIGMQFNLINVAIVPLILGIGVDNGVHILHRYRGETEHRVARAVEHTGKAIFLSALTTITGFGTLGLASYVAVGTLGQLLAVGVFFCFLSSVYVLPLVLSWFDRKGWRV
ncbi:MAG: MMPL family transporter [Deltaproteobacteria bacterium]|nr:MMPL family transporter [Deltaproteobacteria bacterium]